MTREEAIKRFENVKANALVQKASGVSEYWQNEIDGTVEAIDMAIEALSADRPTHERDLISRHDALMELNGACEMWEDDAIVADIIHKLPSMEIVRCKDCRYCTEYYDRDGYPYWECAEWDGGTDADGFCHYGERREP